MELAPSAIYTLSLHDALPISAVGCLLSIVCTTALKMIRSGTIDDLSASTRGIIMVNVSTNIEINLLIMGMGIDRKSTRLNSSHLGISYAVFCLKKKKKNNDKG